MTHAWYTVYVDEAIGMQPFLMLTYFVLIEYYVTFTGPINWADYLFCSIEKIRVTFDVVTART